MHLLCDLLLLTTFAFFSLLHAVWLWIRVDQVIRWLAFSGRTIVLGEDSGQTQIAHYYSNKGSVGAILYTLKLPHLSMTTQEI